MSQRGQHSKKNQPGAELATLKAAADPRLAKLSGRREIRLLSKLIDSLAATSEHGNRLLKMHHVLTAHLLGFFNPIIRSLRTFELASQSHHVQKFIDIPRICRSTHSDFLSVAKPELLLPLIRSLKKRLPDWRARDGELGELLDRMETYDSSFFEVPATVAWAMRGHFNPPGQQAAGSSTKRQKKIPFARIRLNLHYCHRRGNPECVSVDDGSGPESAGMLKHVEPGSIMVADRGLFSYRLLDDLAALKAHCVLRVKKDIRFIASQELPLSAEDAAHGVVSDRMGGFGASRQSTAPKGVYREITIIEDPTHPERVIRLVTDLQGPPAYIIGMLYQQRWQIELFFRWLKVFNNFDHLVTHSREGMTFVFYVMVIALLLHAVLHGRPASKYDVLAYQLAISGGRADPGLMAGLARLMRERELGRERYARKKALKKIA